MLRVADAERLFLYNDSARRIWESLAAGLKPNEIAAALAEANDSRSATIQADVDLLAAQWRDDNQRRRAMSPPYRADLPPLGDPVWAARWTCRIRGRQIGFAAENPSHARSLRRLLGHLEVEEDLAEMRLEVRDADGGRLAIFQNGSELARIPARGLRDTIHATIIDYLWPDRPISALVHGGAVAMGETGICFPAFGGSGKTTLVAHLIGRGLAYLADDLTPIDASGTMLPWPVPLSVKQGSWEMLKGLHPSLADGPSFRTPKGEARLLTPRADTCRDIPTRLGALVFPRYDQDANTELVKLRPFQALEQLYKAGMWLGHPLSEARVRLFLTWLHRTPAYSLTYSRLDEAETEIFGLLAVGGEITHPSVPPPTMRSRETGMSDLPARDKHLSDPGLAEPWAS